MKILGIDPGYDRLGLALIEKPLRGKESLIYSECFQTSSKDSIYERLRAVGDEVNRVIDLYTPDTIAIENLFMSKNQTTAMRVAEARGIIIYMAAQKGLPIFEYNPMQIKVATTGDGSSDKGRVIKMVHMLIDMPKKSAKDDEYDAIAVALTHAAISPLKNIRT